MDVGAGRAAVRVNLGQDTLVDRVTVVQHVLRDVEVSDPLEALCEELAAAVHVLDVVIADYRPRPRLGPPPRMFDGVEVAPEGPIAP